MRIYQGGNHMKTRDRSRLEPESCTRALTLGSLLARSAQALLVSAFALLPTAQAQVVMVLGNAHVFEGNSGTTTLNMPITFVGTLTSDAHLNVSAIAASGTGFHPATAGAACGGGVDFISFSNVPFTIPANTTTFNIPVTVCGDTTIESDEQIFLLASSVTGGAFCTADSCASIGTIVNDDGPPGVSINSISVSEPAFAGSTKTASFTVSLNHPFSQNVSVHFATRDGTATSICSLFKVCSPDYVSTSGTVTIPASTSTVTNLSATIPVTIRGDGISEPDQSFFMDLSSPSPTGVTILAGTGQATIHDTTLTIGAFDLSPDDGLVENGDTLAFDLTWTVPDGETWHDLKSLDFRIGDYGEPVLWVRWDEASNTFSLCGVGGSNAAQTHHGGGQPPANCGPGSAPGSETPLFTPSAQLVLAETTVTGSGPTGLSVALHLVVSFGPEINARSYPIWLSVADDFGNEDKFVRAGEITVE